MADPLRDGDGGPAGGSLGHLELFFDLIFVINIAGLTHHLVAHPDGETLGSVAALYLPLFLAPATYRLSRRRRCGRRRRRSAAYGGRPAGRE